jgi:hypothetical protein
MAFLTDNKAIVAFKNALGKSNTDVLKEIGNESEGIFFNLPAKTIFIDEIDPNPAISVGTGVATAVTADMVEDITSNGHSFFACAPVVIPFGAGVLDIGKRYVVITTVVHETVTYSTGEAFTALTKNLTSGTVKEMLKNIIPPSFGFGYEAKPIDTGSQPIPVGDPRDWIFQYQSGVFFQQDNVGADPLTMNLYVYSGKTLADANVGGGGSEFQDSVFTRTPTPPVAPVEGDRYLITAPATGVWVGEEDKIATFNGTIYVFTTPTNGMSVKVDDEDNALLHYEGNYPSGVWEKYPLSEVRAGLATGTNVYSVTVNPPLANGYETQMVFLISFQNDNTASATLNVNGEGIKDIKKDDGSGTLVSLNSGDIQSGIVYMLVYDGTQFNMFVIGGSGVVNIGPAEDGDYSDGVFTDFVPSTPVGTAVDRFNELLLNLVPPKAPDLTDHTAIKTGITKNGKLSFDSANPIAGGSYVGADGAPSPVSVDGVWTEAGKRIGIVGAATGDITGILNDQVLQHVSVPFAAYPADSFGNADKGTLKLFINGIEKDSVDLTIAFGVDNTVGNTVSGLITSPTFASVFPLGADFELHMNRTATWLVVDNDPLLVQGYNYIHVVHAYDATILTLTRFEFIVDDNTTATAYSGEVLDVLNMTGSKKISGVDYHTAGTAEYDITINNAYRNTYYGDADAITHGGTNLSAPQEALASSLGDELKVVTITNKIATISPVTGLRLLKGSIGLDTSTKRTVQSTITSTGVAINNILLDSVIPTSTLISESFDDEVYRLPSNVNFENFSAMIASVYDSEQSIKSSDAIAGYADAMQIIGGKLVYPGGNVGFPADFRTSNIVNGSVWNDGGTKGTARDYSGETGNKVYYRFFKQVAPTVSNFIIDVNGNASINFVPVLTALTGNNAHLEIKAPSQTGWLDGYKDFATGQFANGDGGRNLTGGAGGINNPLGLTIGTKSTALSGGIIVVKITVGSSFTLDFSDISFTF